MEHGCAPAGVLTMETAGEKTNAAKTDVEPWPVLDQNFNLTFIYFLLL